jgi:virginiamycin B lyase
MSDHDDAARHERSARSRAGLLAAAVATALLAAVCAGSPASASPAPGRAPAVAGYLYWSNTIGRVTKPGNGMIGRARLNGTGVDQKFIAVPNGPSGVAGLAVNCRYIYWTNEEGDEIGRASLNGTGADQKFITGGSFPDAIAVGPHYLYWTNQNSHAIGRARLNGTDVNQRFVAKSDFLNLHGVAAAPSGAQLTRLEPGSSGQL